MLTVPAQHKRQKARLGGSGGGWQRGLVPLPAGRMAPRSGDVRTMGRRRPGSRPPPQGFASTWSSYRTAPTAAFPASHRREGPCPPSWPAWRPKGYASSILCLRHKGAARPAVKPQEHHPKAPVSGTRSNTNKWRLLQTQAARSANECSYKPRQQEQQNPRHSNRQSLNRLIGLQHLQGRP